MPIQNDEMMARDFTRMRRGGNPQSFGDGKQNPQPVPPQMNPVPPARPPMGAMPQRQAPQSQGMGVQQGMDEQSPARRPVPPQYRPQTIDPNVVRMAMARNAMAQREANAMAGQKLANQVSQMRQVSPSGILQDPNFVRYQANVIKKALFTDQVRGFLNGNLSARDLANTEDYLKSVTDGELVGRYPYFFDFERDGGSYLMDLEKRRQEEEESYPPQYEGYGEAPYEGA